MGTELRDLYDTMALRKGTGMSALKVAPAMKDYFETYVQRDPRELVQLRHLSEFERFVRLAAVSTI